MLVDHSLTALNHTHQLNDDWHSFVEQEQSLYLVTLKSRSLANSISFYWRDRLIRAVTPSEVTILSLEFDFDHQHRLAQSNSSASSQLTWHGMMLHQLSKLLPTSAYCLVVDSDALPLSEAAVKTTFLMAQEHLISGNLQRTNCISNGEHLFIAPSFLCFKNLLVQRHGIDNWRINNRSDTSEEIVWLNSLDVSSYGFRPKRTLFKPIWSLEGCKPVYGVGTFFGTPDLDISYHHFYARNLVSRIHFFFITFYLYLRCQPTNSSQPTPASLIKLAKHEIVFGIRYLLGKAY